MKTIIPFLLAFFLLSSAGKATAQNCCAKPQSMKMLAMNTDFKATHEPPAPFTYNSDRGKMITFPTAGGAEGNAFFIPSDGPTNKVLIVFHEWWGLNDYIKLETENWQKSLGKVDVYAIDLYDGQVATDPDKAGHLMESLDAKRGSAIIDGLMTRIGGNKKIATIGWCIGGSWSFTGTIQAKKEATGCVMYYGFPETDVKRIKPLRADVCYIRGDKDKYITADAVAKFGEQVKATGHTFSMMAFPADHAFANPSNPKYDSKSTKEAHAIAEKFLKEKLGL